MNCKIYALTLGEQKVLDNFLEENLRTGVSDRLLRMEEVLESSTKREERGRVESLVD